MMSSGTRSSKNRQAVSLQGVDPETCMIVFKTHWGQVVKILEKHDPLKNTQAKYGAIPPDEASTVQNYVEHMLFLLIEEQAKDAAMGPILEFVVTENIMEKLFLWSLRREFTDETKIEQLKMYEMLVTQSHQPLLHHKPILKPLMMLLSSCSGTATPAVELDLVVLLNQLCSILAKDPSILELFFHTSEDQGAANFLIFSLLIPFIHREGTIGQQARDALLFIMSLSAENNVVANHIVGNTYFCPVLATGLSGLYSSLPTKLEENGEWHCLLKDDWLLSPALVQFMNSLEFCNAVIQVAHPLIRNQLVNYIYNGFLVPVMAPALHKVTVEEVMTTTAYLDLFLRSVSEPALLQIFLRFILLHQHENVHILDTLTSRINTPFQLCVISLALFRTLIGLHCEDVMLQLVLRYLIPCNHMMLSQRWAVRERDCYSVSAAKLLALTPVCCASGITLSLEKQAKDYILWTKAMPSAGSCIGFCNSMCIVKYGRAVDISYLQYLWEAEAIILHCMKDCRVWSAPYDGEDPDPDTFIQTLAEENSKNVEHPMFRLEQRTISNRSSSQMTPLGEKIQLELEWDDSYDTGISPGSDVSSPQPYDDLGSVQTQLPAEPPKHIQEMKKNAIILIKGSYIEESDFQDDVMVYRLCAQKDAQNDDHSKEETLSTAAESQNTVQSQPINRSWKNSHSDTEFKEHNRKNSDLTQDVTKEQINQKVVETDPQPDLELKLSAPEEDHNSNVRLLSPDSEEFIAQYDKIIEELDSNTTELEEQKLLTPDPVSLVEEEEDVENFSVDTPSAETILSPFGPKEDTFSNHSVRSQNAPFTGPFISVVLSKLENMLENSLHVNLLLIGIITQLASYPQPLLRSFLLNTNIVFQPSVRSLYQVLASVKNKIEQFASIQKDFPGLLIQAQQYLLFRADMSDMAPELLTKDNVQHNSSTGKGRNLSEASQTLLQPFLGHKAKKVTALPGIPVHVRNAILAAALFPEFLKELAALAQEHSILCYKILGDFEDYY
ncbi:FHF complex subunit HOOK-interacting protein 1A [Emydura macquarii macquarii]|uniref:FHF complex subunit HOOK-interacting protein 1A n=1 Tax=Emydura macquarii macquarii TaxID=1129001 RepID=UPI00352ACE9F